MAAVKQKAFVPGCLVVFLGVSEVCWGMIQDGKTRKRWESKKILLNLTQTERHHCTSLLRHSYIVDFDWTHDEWYNGSSLRCSNGIPVTFLTSTAGRSRKTYMNLLLLCLPREAILQNPLDQPINWFHPIPHSVFNISNHDLLLINKKDILMFCELHFLSIKHDFNKFPFQILSPMFQKRSCDSRAFSQELGTLCPVDAAASRQKAAWFHVGRPRLQPPKHEDNLWDIEGWKMMGPASSHGLPFHYQV